MQVDETVAAPASGGLDDDDVDLSFAGPESVATAPWPARMLDLVSAYLPLLMMAALASGTWWLVRNAPTVETPREVATPRHEPDYEMTTFVVQRFAKDGSLQTQIEGDRLRHFPDNDTLEIERARLRAVGSDGVVTLASANKALANGDGSEVQLLGDARIVRPAHGNEEQVEFRGEFLHAFRNVERVRSHLPVVVTQGASVVHADGMEYDNLARVVELRGRTRATFVSPPRKGSP
jgi:lipopolysaccharide export system protein LptC